MLFGVDVGVSTLSITWITPLLVVTSAETTLASFTITASNSKAQTLFVESGQLHNFQLSKPLNRLLRDIVRCLKVSPCPPGVSTCKVNICINKGLVGRGKYGEWPFTLQSFKQIGLDYC